MQAEDAAGHDGAVADVGGGGRWFSWLLGIAAVVAVVVVARAVADERELVQVVERAAPGWLLVAGALQAMTYLAEAQIWRRIVATVGGAVSVADALRLSLAKLFVSQALPSGGLSGTVVAARFLGQRGLSRAAVAGALVVDVVAYYAAYVVCLAGALVVAGARHQLSAVVLGLGAGFGAVAVTTTAVLLRLAGRPTPAGLLRLARVAVLRRGLALLQDAERALVRDPRVLVVAGSCQVAVVFCDAATVGCLIAALGGDAAPTAVFVSFMTSSLFRTLGVLPGGLGTFEGASVLTLNLAGVPVTVAVGATLLFRALSFWLPMVPGLLVSRALARSPTARAAQQPSTHPPRA